MFKRTDISSLELTFVSKDDCHLCEDALEVVERLRRKRPFKLRVVKITPGDEWHQKYWDKIPVGLVDGRMLFKYHVDENNLVKQLERVVSPR